MTDPIADMLTRIRNALTAKHDSVEIPASNMKKEIANILLSEGFVQDVKFEDPPENGEKRRVSAAASFGPAPEFWAQCRRWKG